MLIPFIVSLIFHTDNLSFNLSNHTTLDTLSPPLNMANNHIFTVYSNHLPIRK